jgi:hypothetical protein
MKDMIMVNGRMPFGKQFNGTGIFITLLLIVSAGYKGYGDDITDAEVVKILGNSHYRARVSLFMKLVTAKNNIVFLGDSHTERCEWGELLGRKDVVNRGISGDTIAGITNRLGLIAAMRPRAVFLMVGVNDLLLGSTVERTADRYRAMLKALTKALPGNTVRVQSVMPTTSPELNAKIELLNARLKDLSREFSVDYIDVHGQMKGPDGLIKKGFSFDGLHLSGDGYRAWKQAVAPFMK